MVDLSNVMVSMLQLLLMVGVGYLAARLGYLDSHVCDNLTSLLLNITLPAMIVSSVVGLDPTDAGGMLAISFALAVLQFFLLLGVSCLYVRILHVRGTAGRVFEFMGVCAATGLIGVAVADSIFGRASDIISSIFVMTLSLFTYSVGFMLLEIAKQDQGGGCVSRGRSVSVPLKSILNPSVLGSMLAILIFLGRIQLPTVVSGTLSRVGGITSPLAMFIVGAIIAQMDLKGSLREWKLYPFAFARQLVVPVVLFYLLRPVLGNGLLLGVFVIMFAMPTGMMVPTFVRQYGLDYELAAKGTVISTLAAFVCIPLLALVLSLT